MTKQPENYVLGKYRIIVLTFLPQPLGEGGSGGPYVRRAHSVRTPEITSPQAPRAFLSPAELSLE